MERSGRGFTSIKKPKQGPSIAYKQTGYDFMENWKDLTDKDRQMTENARAAFNRPAYAGTIAETKR